MKRDCHEGVMHAKANEYTAALLPEPLTVSMCKSSDYAEGWNACHDAMIAYTYHIAREALRLLSNLNESVSLYADAISSDKRNGMIAAAENVDACVDTLRAMLSAVASESRDRVPDEWRFERDDGGRAVPRSEPSAEHWKEAFGRWVRTTSISGIVATDYSFAWIEANARELLAEHTRAAQARAGKETP